MNRMLPVCALVVFLVVGTSLQAQQTRNVHVIIAGLDHDAAIGRGAQEGRDKLQNLFSMQMPPGVTTRTYHLGKLGDTARPLTAQVLKSTIDGLPVTNSDTLVLFMMTHGGYEPSRVPFGEKFGFGHVLLMGDGSLLPRCTLGNWLVDRQPRFIMLLTDSCNTSITGRIVEFPAAAPAAAAPPKLVSLLLNHAGVVDMNASSGNHEAFYGSSPSYTGSFTQAFFDLAQDEESSVNAKTSWQDFGADLMLRTNQISTSRFGAQFAQTPMWMRSQSRYRFQPPVSAPVAPPAPEDAPAPPAPNSAPPPAEPAPR